MQALPARDRAVLHLYYYEGYQTAEIAALTGLRRARCAPASPAPGPDCAKC